MAERPCGDATCQFRRIVLILATAAAGRGGRGPACADRPGRPQGLAPDLLHDLLGLPQEPAGAGEKRAGGGLPAPALHHRSGDERRDGGLSGRGRERARREERREGRDRGQCQDQGQEAGARDRTAGQRPGRRREGPHIARQAARQATRRQTARGQAAGRAAGRAAFAAAGRDAGRARRHPPGGGARHAVNRCAGAGSNAARAGRAAGPPLVTFDVPLPTMPDAPPADLTQSVFSSSPVP